MFVQSSTMQQQQPQATDGTGVLCSPAHSCVASLAPRSQEEADTRLLLHVADAVRKGCKKVTIRTTDTDVVVLASFSKIAPDEFPVHRYSRNRCHNDSNQVPDSPCLSRFHWM